MATEELRQVPVAWLQALALGGAGALGLVVGSFLNVVIYRLPLRRSVVTPRSACPGCGMLIRWFDNIPVLSWLLLRGRCRGCRTAIAPRYALVELLTGGLFALAVWLFVVRHPDGLFDGFRWARFAIAPPYLGLLVALSFIDFDHRLLPDRLTKPGIAAGALASVLVPALQPTHWLPGMVPGGAALALSLGAAVLGYGSLWLVAWIGEKALGREAMGLGDAKLLALIGAFTGPVGVGLTAAVGLAVGVAIGLVNQVLHKDAYFPFGPALAVGGVAAFVAPAETAGLVAGFQDGMTDPRFSLVVMLVCGVLLFSVRGKLPRVLFWAFVVLLALTTGLNVLLLR